MSTVESIRIRNLRCVRSADLALPAGLVWVSGANGAGKTTLLEAMYLLDRGRTFRGRRGGPLTTRGEQGTGVLGLISTGGQSRKYRWTTSGAPGKGSGPPFTRLVGTASFSIVEGDPALRRRFLDWSLFHVEPDAKAIWSRLQRLQRQRNAWLRGGGQGAPIWDVSYADALASAWQRRVGFLLRVNEAFTALTSQLSPTGALRLQWQWTGQGQGVREVLDAQRAKDVERGYTFLSASRGDVVFRRGDDAWNGSRGENKLAGILLQLAVQRIVRSTTGQGQVALLDDPFSEVSARYVAPVIAEWLAEASQVIVTSLEESPSSAPQIQPTARFHVEQGRITPA